MTWPRVKLGEVCEILSGFAFDSKRFNDKDGLPIVRIRDVTRGFSTTYYDGAFDERFVLSKGDILIGMDGEFNRAKWGDQKAVLNQRVCKIEARGNLDRDYMFHFLPAALKEIEDATPFVTVKHLSVRGIQNIEIPLPPLEEQKRLATILDRADELRCVRRKVLSGLDELAQSLFLELFGDPATNPKGWPTSTLGDIATFIGGGTPRRARPEFFEGTICWATSKDMKCEFLEDTEEHITPEAIQESATNLVPAGTILIVVKSKILAHSLPVAIARVPTCFGQDLKGIKVSDQANVTFVTTALRSNKRWLIKRARGINTEGLTLDHLKAFPLPLPPLESQQQFAEQIEELEAIKTRARASLLELDALFASLQSRAFAGELSPSA